MTKRILGRLLVFGLFSSVVAGSEAGPPFFTTTGKLVRIGTGWASEGFYLNLDVDTANNNCKAKNFLFMERDHPQYRGTVSIALLSKHGRSTYTTMAVAGATRSSSSRFPSVRRPEIGSPMVKAFAAITLAVLSAAPTISAGAGVDVLVGRYDRRGSGTNLREAILNTSNVNPARFGKLFSYEVEGFVYAQPLIVSGVRVQGRVRNVLYVATTNNMVYALDADDSGPAGGLLWQVRLTDHGAFPAPSVKTFQTVQGNIGILSTPVIDRAGGAIYVVARSLGPKGFQQRLHALDLVTGREKPRSPVNIAPASVVRDGITFTFDPAIQSNRAGLTISTGKVIIAWSGLDAGHGWVMAYDANTLLRTGIFCTTCARAVVAPGPLDCAEPQKPWLIGGGIWQSGRPPVVDAKGHVYYFVGNGWTHGCIGKTHWYATSCEPGQPKPIGYYGESLVRLDPRNGSHWSGRGRPLLGVRSNSATTISGDPAPS